MFLFCPFCSKGVPWEFGTKISVNSKKRLDVLAYLLLAVKSNFGRRLKMKKLYKNKGIKLL